MGDNQTGDAQKAGCAPISGADSQIALFRITDILLGINQACTEAALQLRISHLHQLKKDRKSVLERLFLICVAAATIVPTIDHFYPKTDLKAWWLGSLLLLFFSTLILERDRFSKQTPRDHEDVNEYNRIVKVGQERLFVDYVSGFVTRHDMVHQALLLADGVTKHSLWTILDSYNPTLRRAKTELIDLKNKRSADTPEKTYDALIDDIKICEERYQALAKTM